MSPDGSPQGLFPEVAKELGKRLNLTFELSLFRERNQWATFYKNGSLGGDLGDIIKGHFHTSLAGYIPTAERSLKADFTIGLSTSNQGVIIKRPGANDISAAIYTKQFLTAAWTVTFLFFSLCLAVLLCSLWRDDSNSKANPLVASIETTFLAAMNKVTFKFNDCKC